MTVTQEHSTTETETEIPPRETSPVITNIRDKFFNALRLERQDPMNQEESEFLIRLTCSPREIVSEILADVSLDRSIQILRNITSQYGRRLDGKATLWLASMVTSPGDCRMLIAYSVWMVNRFNRPGKEKNVIDLEDLVHFVFPNGLYRQPLLDQVWDAQKREDFHGNYLDDLAIVCWLREGGY